MKSKKHKEANRFNYATYRLTLKSPAAQNLANTIWPTIINLSFLVLRVQPRLPALEFHRTMRAVMALIDQARAAVAVERAALAQKRQLSRISQTLDCRFAPTCQREVKCATPWARALFKLLQDLLALDEDWATFAWQADAALPPTPDWPEISHYATYERQCREWAARMRRLRDGIRQHLETLKQQAGEKQHG